MHARHIGTVRQQQGFPLPHIFAKSILFRHSCVFCGLPATHPRTRFFPSPCRAHKHRPKVFRSVHVPCRCKKIRRAERGDLKDHRMLVVGYLYDLKDG